MSKERTIETLTIESSVLACNFVNTVYAWRGVNLNEYLKTYEDVIAWCKKLHVMEAQDIDVLARTAVEAPKQADKALVQMKLVRELIYRLISAIASQDSDATRASLELLNPYIAKTLSRQCLSYQEGQFQALLQKEPTDLLSPIWPVLVSLNNLLLNEDPKRIKECSKCGWVFLDETKNGKRRWCSPVECGTQDKMLRYNLKKRG